MLTSTKDYHSHLAKNSEVAIVMSIVFMVYEGRGCNKMYFFTFSLQPFLHTKTTKALEIVLSQDILVVFPFLGALK